MKIIRKAKAGEMNKILEVINSAFETVRYKGYDIRNSIARIYDTKKDYSPIHCIIEEDSKFVTTAGNLIQEVNVNEELYPFSIIGSVATLPSAQHNGLMKEVISYLDNENREKEVVFSMLTGLRHRYNYFGYEKAGFKFCFEINKHFAKHHSEETDLKIEIYKNDYFDIIYDLFLQSNHFIKRDKEEFVSTLKKGNSDIFIIRLDEKIIGYLTFSASKGVINEILMKDYSLLPFTLKKFITLSNFEKIKVYASPFNVDLIFELDKISEYKNVFDELHFKVFDICRFLEMVINMNLKIKKLPNLQKIIKIDGEIIQINIFNGNVIVELTDKPFEREFDRKEFLRYAFSINSVYENDNLFPLFLDFDNCDLF